MLVYIMQLFIYLSFSVILLCFIVMYTSSFIGIKVAGDVQFSIVS